MFQGLKEKVEYTKNISNEKINILDKLNFKSLVGSFKNLIIFLVCGLVASCEIGSGVAPLGSAIFCAVSAIEVPLMIPFIMISVVTGIKFGGLALLKFVIVALLFTSIKSFIKVENTKVNNACIVIFGTIMAEIVGLSIEGLILYNTLVGIYTSVMSAVFYLVFAEGLPTIYDLSKPKVNSTENVISTGILIAVMVSSLGNIGLFGITIRGIISILIVMLLGWRRGPATGATAGLSISLVIGIMGYGTIATVATYAFCGFLVGVLARFGKMGAVVGFVLGNMILVFYANGSTEVLISIKEIIVASVALFLVPKKLIIVIEDLFDYNRTLPGNQNVAGYIEENTIYKLNAVSDVISDMADNISTNKIDIPVTDEMGSFIKTLNENTCKKCENYENCWKNNYHKMYELTFNAIEILQTKGEVLSSDFEDSVCLNRAMLADGLNFSYEMYKVNKNWQEKIKEQRIQMAMQLKEVSKELDKVKEELASRAIAKDEEVKQDKPYRLDLGIAKAKKTNSAISRR